MNCDSGGQHAHYKVLLLLDVGLRWCLNMHIKKTNITKWDISFAALVKQLKGDDEQGIWGT